MKKNIRILYCILGSLLLTLLKSSLFEPALYALLGGRGYGSSLFGFIIYNVINVLSFIGVILLTVFSIALIIINLISKE